MDNGFGDCGRFSAYMQCFAYELRRIAAKFLRVLTKRKRSVASFAVRHRYSEWQAKAIVLNERLAITTDRNLSWFYTAFDRNDADPLTNYLLRYVEEHVQRDARILVTGCGTGIMAFHLADSGYRNIEASDILEKCIRVANQLKNEFNYSAINFFTDDGFCPKISGTYDLITAVHWVFSAWMGNYGNSAVENPYEKSVREKLLDRLIGVYAPHLNVGGLFVIELTDAVADYRDPYDHSLGVESLKIYPVRHSPEQVTAVAGKNGLEVVEKRLSVSYGHHPRTSYVLRKIAI